MKRKKGKAILLSILLTITMLFSGVTGFATTIIPEVGGGNEEALEINFATQVDVNSISGKNYDLTVHYDAGASSVEVTFANLQSGVANAFKYSLSSGNNWIDYTGPFSLPVTATELNVKLLSPSGSPNGELLMHASLSFEEIQPPPAEYEITTVVMTDGEIDSAGGTADGAGIYEENTTFNLVAAANSGFNFIGWYADEELTDLLSEELAYEITVTGEETYYAAFETEEEPPPPADPVSMNFFADVSGIFSESESDFIIQRDESETNLTFDLLYPGPVEVARVQFNVPQEELMPILQSDGSWTVGGFLPGELVTMTVSNVNSDFVYDYLEVDDSADESMTYTFTVPEMDFSSMAAFYEEEGTTPGGGGGFTPITYALKVKVIGNGTVDPSVGVHRYSPGTVVDIDPSAMNGWEFFGWDGPVQDEQIVMNGDRTVTAIFQRIEEVPLAPPTVTPPPIIILDEEIPKDDGALPDAGVDASMSHLLLGAGSILMGILNRKKK